jgi:predicted enzyme related to lactoylglutathione lyase
MLSDFPMNGFVPVADGDRARAFYEGVLGLELADDNEYVATYRSGSNNIMLQKGMQTPPAERTIVGWEVSNIREVIQQLTERGVKFLRLNMDWLKQDDLGIWESPGGKVAWFKDPDGNTLSVSEH